MGGKNIQNHHRPVNDLTLQLFLKISNLCRRQLIVTDYRIRLLTVDHLPKFFQFALADIGSWMDAFPVLDQPPHSLGACGLRQFLQLIQGNVCCCFTALLFFSERDRYQDHPLPPLCCIIKICHMVCPPKILQLIPIFLLSL